MIRKSVLLLLLMLLPVTATALGLGGISVNSKLNQPLDADIELIGANADQLVDIKARLASAALFEKAGLERPYLLSKLRFHPSASADGRVFIRVSSTQTVVEPVVIFLLEVSVSGGHFMREYAVLLDPPMFQAEVGAVTASAPDQYSPMTGEAYGPVAGGETLWKIAERYRSDRSVTIEQMMLALQRRNPEAFIGGNINRLKRGVTLTIPDRQTALEMGATEASQQFQQQTTQWRRQPVTPTAARVPAELLRPEPAPVQKNEIAGTAEKSLKVVESTKEQLSSNEKKVVYPTNEIDTLQETIIDAETDLEAAREINRGLADLRGMLESRIDELHQALGERDRLIEEMTRHLNALEQGDQAPVASEPGVVESPVGEPLQTVSVAPATTAESSADINTAVSLAADSSSGLVKTGLSWLSRYWLIVVATVTWLAIILFILLWRRGQGDGLTERRAELDLFQSIDLDDETEAFEPQPRRAASVDAQAGKDVLVSSVGGGLAKVKGDISAILMEVDVYLAYRRYDEAKAQVMAAIASYPENPELKGKLLEIFLFQRDKQGFSSCLDEVSPFMAKNAPALWRRIAEMGRDLVPDHPALATVVSGGKMGLGAGSVPASTSQGRKATFGIEADPLPNSAVEGEHTPSVDDAQVADVEPNLDLDLDLNLDLDSETPATLDHELLALVEEGIDGDEIQAHEYIDIDALDLSDIEEIDLDLDTKPENGK